MANNTNLNKSFVNMVNSIDTTAKSIVNNPVSQGVIGAGKTYLKTGDPTLAVLGGATAYANAKNPPKPKKRSWTNNTPATPTYVDPNGVTHTGMTQNEFDNRMAAYDAELTELNNNDIARQRNRMIGNTTYDQIFKDAVAKFQADPNSFNEKQKQALLDSGIKLGYWQSPSQTQQPTSQQAPVTQSNNIVNAAPDAAGAGGRDEGYAASDKDNKIQGGANAIGFYL